MQIRRVRKPQRLSREISMERPSIDSHVASLNKFIVEGEQLLKKCSSNYSEDGQVYRIDKSSGIALPISSVIDGWLKRSTDYLVSLFPNIILESDFSEAKKAHDLLFENQSIIIENSTTYIISILNSLKRCLSFSKWLDAFDEKKLSSKQRAELNHSALEAYFLYIQENLIPRLPQLEDGRTKKTAILHLYGRVFLLVQSVVKLNNVRCCQLLPASLRSLFEIYIDMILLQKESIIDDSEKFFSFSELYKYKSAKNLERIDKELGKNTKEKIVNKYINNFTHKVSEKKKLWGKKIPIHWTNLSLEDRSRLIGELSTYRDIYYYGNMYIHSGYLVFPKTEEDADFLCAYTYGFSIHIFQKSTHILFEVVSLKKIKYMLEESNKIFLMFGYFQFWKKTNQE